MHLKTIGQRLTILQFWYVQRGIVLGKAVRVLGPYVERVAAVARQVVRMEIVFGCCVVNRNLRRRDDIIEFVSVSVCVLNAAPVHIEIGA